MSSTTVWGEGLVMTCTACIMSVPSVCWVRCWATTEKQKPGKIGSGCFILSFADSALYNTVLGTVSSYKVHNGSRQWSKSVQAQGVTARTACVDEEGNRDIYDFFKETVVKKNTKEYLKNIFRKTLIFFHISTVSRRTQATTTKVAMIPAWKQEKMRLFRSNCSCRGFGIQGCLGNNQNCVSVADAALLPSNILARETGWIFDPNLQSQPVQVHLWWGRREEINKEKGAIKRSRSTVSLSLCWCRAGDLNRDEKRNGWKWPELALVLF